MASQAARGKKALDEKNYEQAVAEYTSAIKDSPTSPDFFIQRSTAYQRWGKHDEALADAEQAVLNGQKRAKKEAIIEGQLRRGIALNVLGRYGDADLILNKVKAMKSDHKQVDLWIARNTKSLQDLAEDDVRKTVTVSETPTLKENATSVNDTSAASPPAQASTTNPAAAPSQTPADKIRYEWYQNTENIYFTLLAKGVPKDKIHVDIDEQSMEVSFPLQAGSSYNLTLDPLFGPVKPGKCITRVMPSKVEIILVKQSPGLKWSALEGSEPVKKADSAVDSDSKTDEAVKRAVFSEAKQSAPAYPTSSKSGPKDWDKLSRELRVNDGEDGKGPDDDDGGDPANAFFKKLYKGADPDTQRAMMKSYVESNGTALSTNWSEVSQGPVKTEPPDGMEAKQWSK